MNFRQLILLLAEQVGHHQLPVHANANELSEFLGSDAVHHDLVSKVVKSIYKANHCGYLDAPISKSITFAVLGKLQRQIAQSQTADIDQFNLISDFGRVLSKYLADAPSDSEIDTDSPDPEQNRNQNNESGGPAEIYAFKPSRLSISGSTLIRK
ncbi:hypothetical protein ACFL17_02260 [Pseudomonadota bacterium]